MLRPEPDAPGALCDGGKEHAWRWRQAERRRMVLAHVIGAKAGAVVKLDQSQAVFILFGGLIRTAVVLVEDTELHQARL